MPINTPNEREVTGLQSTLRPSGWGGQSGWCGPVSYGKGDYGPEDEICPVGHDGRSPPMQFDSWFNRAFWPSYWTWRHIVKHPTVSLVRALSISGIIASQWGYAKSDDGVPDSLVDMVRRNMDPLRHPFVTSCMGPGRDLGWQPFELVYKVKNGEYGYQKIKPLLQDISVVLRDDNGNVTGVDQYAYTTSGVQWMPTNRMTNKAIATPFKAFVYSYQGTSDGCYNPYGRSWIENLREYAFKQWVRCVARLADLDGRLSGVQLVITGPSGTFSDANGNQVTYSKAALDAIGKLQRGSPGVFLPNLFVNQLQDKFKNLLNKDTAVAIATLVQSSMVNFKQLDFGDRSPAVQGMLAELAHWEGMMFQGGLRPARVGLEGPSGARAETEIKTDSAVTIAEVDDDDLAQQAQQLVDNLLELNAGEDAKGKVRIEPAPLVDLKTATLRALIQAVTHNPDVAMILSRKIGQKWEDIFESLDIPFSPQDVEELYAKIDEQKQKAAEAKGQPGGGSDNAAGRATPLNDGSDNPRPGGRNGTDPKKAAAIDRLADVISQMLTT
jgi:hypothetical protein